MFQEMTVPNIPPGIRPKTDNYPRHFTRIAADRIFPSAFVGCGWYRRSGKEQFLGLVKIADIKRLPVQNLELDQVQMDGVRHKTGIDQIPDLDFVPAGSFGERIMPPFSVKKEF